MAIIIRFRSRTRVGELCKVYREIEYVLRDLFGINVDDESSSFDIYCEECENGNENLDKLCDTCTIYVWGEDEDIVPYLYKLVGKDTGKFEDKLRHLKSIIAELAGHPNAEFVVLSHGLTFEPNTILGVAARKESGIARVIVESMIRIAYLTDASQLLVLLLSCYLEEDIGRKVRERLITAYKEQKSINDICIEYIDTPGVWLVWPCKSKVFVDVALHGRYSPFARFAIELIEDVLKRHINKCV